MSQKNFEIKRAAKKRSMTEDEKKLLNRIQADFPVASKPFEELAGELGIAENVVMGLVKKLKESGIIRRIGAVFDSQRLGYKSTLCAMKVSEQDLDEVAAIVSAYPEVTHNYGREHEFNLWFTLIAKDEKRLMQIIEEIKAQSGCEILDLPAIRLFKINVSFEF